MTLTRPAPIHYPFANEASGSYINAIPDAPTGSALASWRQGFPPVTMTPLGGGGTPPYGADFNGVLKSISENVRWMLAGGPPAYDATLASAIGGYPLGAVLVLNDGITRVICTTAGTTNDPNSGMLGSNGWDYIREAAANNTTNISSASTTSATAVQMGLGGGFPAMTLTLQRGTRMLINIQGLAGNSNPNGLGFARITANTGTAPANGVPAVASLPIYGWLKYQSDANGSIAPFSITAVVSGLTPGVPYWVDLVLYTTSGGGNIFRLTDMTFSLAEI